MCTWKGGGELLCQITIKLIIAMSRVHVNVCECVCVCARIIMRIHFVGKQQALNCDALALRRRQKAEPNLYNL